MMFCHEEKLVMVRQKANSSEFLTQISITVKKCYQLFHLFTLFKVRADESNIGHKMQRILFF